MCKLVMGKCIYFIERSSKNRDTIFWNYNTILGKCQFSPNWPMDSIWSNQNANVRERERETGKERERDLEIPEKWSKIYEEE